MPSAEETAVDAAVPELMPSVMPLMDQYRTAAALRAFEKARARKVDLQRVYEAVIERRSKKRLGSLEAARLSRRGPRPRARGAEGGSTRMGTNRTPHRAARGRLGLVTALLVGLLAGPGAGAPAPEGMRLRVTAHDGQLSVDVHQAEIGAVLAQIGAHAGVRIVWAQPTARQVSAQLAGVELEAGLRHLLRLAALSYVMLYGPGPTAAPVVHEVRIYGGAAPAGDLTAPAAPDPTRPARDAPARTLGGQIAALAARTAAGAPRQTASWPEAEVATRLRQAVMLLPVTALPEDQPPDAAAAPR